MGKLELQRSELLCQAAYVAGDWIKADPDRGIEVTNPSSGEVIGHVPSLGEAETRRAILAAEAARYDWARLTAKMRADVLRRWFVLIMENQEDLARILTAEQGKPLAEARGEISYGASFVEWFAEEARRAYGEIVPGQAADKRILVIKQPIGVVAAITPWNFPSAMITRKVTPALAAGCSVVLKPASQTPLSATALALLAEQAGIPAGLFSVITGRASAIGSVMTSDPLVRKLTFTGSTAVGAKLYAQCAPTLKKLALELGGNAPFIVFDDADVDAAVEGGIIAKFRNNGQTCVCANRIYVQDGIYDEFSKKLAARMTKMKTGDGFDPDSQFGPLIDQAALEKVEEHVRDATGKGAGILVGGKRHTLGGTFYEPTVLIDASPSMLFAHEETFGPVAPLFRFKDEAEVIKAANDSEYGLASYFYSKDLSRVWRVAEALESGIVGVNSGLISATEAPFGGVKHSGLGREGSRHGLEEFLEMKYICLGLQP